MTVFRIAAVVGVVFACLVGVVVFGLIWWHWPVHTALFVAGAGGGLMVGVHWTTGRKLDVEAARTVADTRTDFGMKMAFEVGELEDDIAVYKTVALPDAPQPQPWVNEAANRRHLGGTSSDWGQP